MRQIGAEYTLTDCIVLGHFIKSFNRTDESVGYLVCIEVCTNSRYGWGEQFFLYSLEEANEKMTYFSNNYPIGKQLKCYEGPSWYPILFQVEGYKELNVAVSFMAFGMICFALEMYIRLIERC